MKIFSNFDTNFRQKTFIEYQGKYGVENVLSFGRSKLYRAYKFFLPFFLLVILSVFALIFSYRLLSGEYFWYIITVMIIIFVVFFIPIINKYIDYKMDFIIVTPNSIIMYEQGGFFKKNVITINAQSVKSISIKKESLLYSIFDNGDIIILTEGDINQNGEIKLRRVPRPEKRRNQMVKVVGIDLKANQNPK